MKNPLFVAAVLAACAAGAQAGTFIDQARVRGVEPQYETLTVPRQECSRQWVDDVRRTGSRDYGGAVIGGIAGAVIGNQVGGGHGREAATAVGAVIGAMTGDSIASRGRGETYERVPREVTTCRTVEQAQQRLTGYRVDYEYRGQMYSTFMREQPGATLPVRVSVDPA
jgi:uncharacterized protein YcfJ